MAEQEQNQSEPATPFKLREARKRGSVSKSIELNSLFILAGFLGILSFLGWKISQHQLADDKAIFELAGKLSFDWVTIQHWLVGIALSTFSLLAPFFIMLLVLAPLSNIIQTGPVFSFIPLKPDWDRINPASGLKRFFSTKILFETVKTIIKLVLFGVVIFFSVRALLPFLLGTMYVNPINYAQLSLNLMVSLVFKIVMVLVVIAIFDASFTHWDFLKKMRMSRRELREEIKRREGDPRIKSKLRELQRETLKRSKALGKLPEADVLITNPTHLSIALKYQRGQMIAPQLIAKGAGDLALKMRQTAYRLGIPVLENKPLAQTLFRKVELEEHIPESLYKEVARIFVQLSATRPAYPAGAAK